MKYQVRELPTTNLGLTDFGWTARALARVLLLLLCAFVCSLVFVPWQQSVRGTGEVVAYAALERQQVVKAPISGRVMQWFVQEGKHVEKNAIITKLSDNDPEILARIEREYASVEAQVQAATLSILSMEGRINALQSERQAAIADASAKISMTEEKQRAAERKLDAARATLKTAELNMTRQITLHDKGLVSTRDLELARLAKETAQANVERAIADLNSAKSDVRSRTAAGRGVGSGKQASVDSAKASLQSLFAKKAKAEAELAKVEVRRARQNSMEIRAPREGTVMRFIARQGGEVVKAGDPLFLFVPDTKSRAVQVWVDGNDAPLVTPGRHVRLQFEGWPAVQFVGWPSVAVGTFGGTVDFVDATDDGKGRFRVVIVPDKKDAWPESRYLRQGVRSNAWLLLNRVSIGFEIWRQLNGFPPTIPKGTGLEEKGSELGPVGVGGGRS